nr:DUF4954 family protein [Bacteroides sp.]
MTTTPPPFYHTLSDAQIDALTALGCIFMPGASVKVSPGVTFDPLRFRNVTFGGSVLIAGMPAAVHNALLHDVTIHADVTISRSDIVNYEIMPGATVERTGSMEFRPGTSFTVNTLSEAGGYSVTARPGLTIAEAELEAYGHQPAAPFTPEHGTVGRNSRVCGAARLQSVIIADRAVVGANVIAEDSVIDSDAELTDGAMVYRSYVGRGCRVTKGFTAHDSLFFDNTQMECGEAAAVFAGPHAVSCHKSTLLIACRCSFFNAGSGTNMSNHAYRLGPVHHGMFRRGCKTGSNAYVLWPATFGAFSLISGDHKHHPDTTDLPFSYLIEKDGVLTIMPGMMLRSAGLLRDLDKWPARDRRKDCEPIDCRVLTPDVAEAMVRGIRLLAGVTANTKWEGYHLSAALAMRGRRLYDTALLAWLAPEVIAMAREGAANEFANAAEAWLGKAVTDIADDELASLAERSREARAELIRMARADAAKDLLPSTEASLGTAETNPFIAELSRRLEQLQ